MVWGVKPREDIEEEEDEDIEEDPKTIRSSRRHESHMMRETSLESYEEMQPLLGGMQSKVFSAIYQFNEQGRFPTDREVAVDLKMLPSQVRPRRHELMNMNLITEAGTKSCSVTGRKALTWITSGRNEM